VKVYVDKSPDSGSVLDRYFCGNCGTNLWTESVSRPEFVGKKAICTGTIDGGFNGKPTLELFSQRRYGWLGDLEI